MQGLEAKYGIGEDVIFLGYKEGYKETADSLCVGDVFYVLEHIKLNTYRVIAKNTKVSPTGTMHVLYEDEIGRFSEYEYDESTDKYIRKEVMPTALIPVTTSVVKLTDEVTQAIRNTDDVVNLAQELYQRTEKDRFMLGGILLYINANKIYERYGYTGFQGFGAFCESTLKIKYATARFLINIYEKFTNLEIPMDRIEKIGWTKARYIAPVATKENLDELINFSETHSRDELTEHIKYNYRRTGLKGEVLADEATDPSYTRFFRLFEDDSKAMDLALQLVKNNTEVTDNNEALMFVVRHFLASNLGREAPLEDMIGLLEVFYNVKLSVQKR